MKTLERTDRPEPKTFGQWLEVLVRTFPPPVWRRHRLSRRSTAIFCQSDVRTLEHRCRALWFDQIERRAIQRELLRRCLKMTISRLFGDRTFREADSSFVSHDLSERSIE